MREIQVWKSVRSKEFLHIKSGINSKPVIIRWNFKNVNLHRVARIFRVKRDIVYTIFSANSRYSRILILR